MEIDTCLEPLIGLQNIQEYCEDDHTTYWCVMCDMACGSVINDVILHVISKHHRTNYMKRHYKTFLDTIISAAFMDQDSLIIDLSKRIEKIEGRKSINYSTTGGAYSSRSTVNQMNSNSQSSMDEDMRNATCEESNTITMIIQPDDSRLSDCTSVGPILHRLASQSGHKNIRDMLGNFTESLITSEEEASKAFEVANILSKSLLEYRLKTAP